MINNYFELYEDFEFDLNFHNKFFGKKIVNIIDESKK